MKQKAADDYISRIKTLEMHYGDIDDYYDKDRCQSLLLEFEYTADDERLKRKPLHKIPIRVGSNIRKATSNYRSYIRKYVKFRNETATQTSQTNNIKNDVNKNLTTEKLRYWFVPCDEWFDIEAAFRDFSKLEWWQTQFLMGMKNGDIVYIYKTLPIGEIKYKGRITETRIPYSKLKIDDREYGKKVSGREYNDKDLFFEFEFDKALPKSQITMEMLKSWGLPYFQSRELPEEIAQRIAEAYLLDNDNNDLISRITKPSAPEGKKKEYYTTTYERNPKNRQDCIRLQGTICKVCGFNFYQTYGELGKDFIEVHHKKPLYSLDEEIVINPAEDLVAVCSNCHHMLHRNKDEILTIEDLIKLISK
ncbi:MAG: HNH endonuclease [Firmicutes bacterium]|nr:HNH endonuclease [Bacillota bacterium]